MARDQPQPGFFYSVSSDILRNINVAKTIEKYNFLSKRKRDREYLPKHKKIQFVFTAGM